MTALFGEQSEGGKTEVKEQQWKRDRSTEDSQGVKQICVLCHQDRPGCPHFQSKPLEIGL